MNAIMYPLMSAINIGYLVKKYKRWSYQKENLQHYCLTQKQANICFENPSFQIDTISANLINMLLLTSFFSPLIPLGLVFSLIYFIANYWILKVFILNKFILFFLLSVHTSQKINCDK